MNNLPTVQTHDLMITSRTLCHYAVMLNRPILRNVPRRNDEATEEKKVEQIKE